MGYVSALTLVRGSDGGAHDYVDLAAELGDVSAAVDADLAALWRRIALSVAIHNTDDHFRNHGMLRARGGWRLSPLFDVNPNPDLAAERVASIGWTTERSAGPESLVESAPHFGLSEERARRILADVELATRGWRDVARTNGIAERELVRFEGAFEGLRPQLRTLT